MSRKDVFGQLPTIEAHAAGVAPGSQRRPVTRPLMESHEAQATDTARRSPVGALGQSLGEMSERSKRADEIERMLSAGERVVELDVDDLEPSFIPDRMQVDDEAFAGFVESIRVEGQHVPILARPHPHKPEKYEIAFGHRRWRAAKVLQRKVKTLIRPLTDKELVIAQGQENNARQDLSFVEKALFAQRLDKQFSRDVITSAMGIYSSDLSYMLSVASKVPEDLVEKIGPAHSVGRRSWVAFSNLLLTNENLAKARSFASESAFGAMPSKERFDAIVQKLSEAPLLKPDAIPVSHAGRQVGKIIETKQKLTLTVDKANSPEFASFVLTELPRLFELHQKQDR
ncbi:MAG: plasmid partitioning protein RepB [Kaiparowitsia implicata GSE-PSE-MK54-09C]|jgi:ParB family chromosome partitioning protein|nr:plasmid partitioning protein RepB [Kaiparowitsia implicata GSE-PSE-MK54-09C]